MLKPADLGTEIFPTWCPGCGNFGIWGAWKKAISDLNLDIDKVLAVYGIGCSGNGADFTKTYAFHALHGRTLPVATGAELSNPELTVVTFAGDGDGYGIGLSHFIHSVRRNIDITFIVHNNQVYGLTTGQTSPTSDKGFKTKSTPHGVIEKPVNPIALALSSNGSFVARGFAGDINHLTGLIKEAINHRGFSLVDVFQPCITFNKKNTYQWFRERIYKLEETDYKTDNRKKAFEKALEEDDKLPIGIFYREKRPTYADELYSYVDKPLFKQKLDSIDISELIEELT